MKKIGIAVLLFLATLLLINVCLVALGNGYTDFSVERQLNLEESEYTASVEFDEPNVVSFDGIELTDYHVGLVFSPVEKGKTEATVFVTEGEETYQYKMTFVVGSFNQLLVKYYENSFYYFNGWVTIIYGVAVYMLGLAVYLFVSFSKRLKKPEDRFSYKTVLQLSVAIMATAIALQLGAAGVFLHINYEFYNVNSAFNLLSDVMSVIVFVFLPLVVIFSILMSISNLSLIRHEGFRLVNLLGIGISVVLLLACAMLYVASAFFYNYIPSVVVYIYAAWLGFFECMIIATVICALISVRHKPSYDKDYIIILGCGINKDGTLMPLLRGRVDRAISFYREQEKKSGKKAIFVPSGGQGNDEIISESEAMKRYLLEQGIPEEQIMKEDRSTNTLENMQFSKRLIDERGEGDKAVFSTTNYHVFRSGLLSAQAGLNADGIGSKTKWYFWPNAFIRETIGLIVKSWKYELVAFLLVALLTAGNILLNSYVFDIILGI